jgi:hypothetical protein
VGTINNMMRGTIPLVRRNKFDGVNRTKKSCEGTKESDPRETTIVVIRNN